MKRIFKSLVSLIINTFIFCFIVLIFFVLLFFIFTKIANMEIDNPISYLKSMSNETNVVSTIPTNNTYVPSYTEHDININMGSNISAQDTSSPDVSADTKIDTKYYYNQLDNYEKIIYNSLENNIDNLKKTNYTIDFSTQFNELLHESNGQTTLNQVFQTALDAFFYDHPELFYIDLTKISLVITSKSIGPITTYTTSLAPKDGKNYLNNNFNTEQLANDAIAKAENIRNDIINYVANYDNYNKILAVHDMLVNSLDYGTLNSTNDNSHNIYGALIERKVVCEGYAKAFKYILDSLGIECILVSGTATNSSNETEAHMWNYIKLDNSWYGVDVTWDDPVVIGGGNSNTLRRNYFCKGSYIFNKGHTANRKISDNGKPFSLPTLSDENYK